MESLLTVSFVFILVVMALTLIGIAIITNTLQRLLNKYSELSSRIDLIEKNSTKQCEGEML